MITAKWHKYGDADNAIYFISAYYNDIPVAVGFYNAIKGNDIILGPLAVVSKYRRQGIGGLVMRMLIRRAFDCGYHETYVLTPLKEEGFFLKLGYSRIFLEGNYAYMRREGDVTGRC